jgi:two-component system sensor histidine kinase/response regulator
VATASIGEDEKPAGRILLVEDNPSNLKLARIMVTKAGYHVDEACNGRDAVQTYTAAPDKYDLILMDVLMPEMDGLRATELIRAEGFDKVPIIAMTANAMKDDSERSWLPE